MSPNQTKDNKGEKKREWELGYILEADVPIISFSASKARLIHYQSFKQLSQLILKLADSLPNKMLSAQDLEIYLALPLPLATRIFQNLIDEQYLIEIDEVREISTVKKATINWDKVNDLEVIPSEEIIRPIRYNFATFPRYYIPNYLLIEKNVHSKAKSIPLPQDLRLTPENINKIREAIELPEEFIRLEPDSKNKTYTNGAKAVLTIIPTENRDEPTLLVKRSSIEPRRISLTDLHPDYIQIRDILEKIEIKAEVLDSIKQISDTIKACVEFNERHKYWEIKIEKIEIKGLKTLIESLETSIPNLFSGNPIKRFAKDLPNLHPKLGKTRLICQIKLDFYEYLLPFVFYEYLVRSFSRFQGDLDRLEGFLLKSRKAFLKYYNLSETFLIFNKKQLAEYCWNSNQFQFAYCLMALEDF